MNTSVSILNNLQLPSSAWEKWCNHVSSAIKLFGLQKNTAIITANTETREIRFMYFDPPQNLSAAGWQ